MSSDPEVVRDVRFRVGRPAVHASTGSGEFSDFVVDSGKTVLLDAMGRKRRGKGGRALVSARRQLLATALVVMILGPQVAAADTLSPGVRCAIAKLRAAAKKHGARVRCHSKALLAGQPVDAPCLAASEAKFDAAFARAEATGGCVTSSDAPAVEADVEACVGALVGLLAPGVTTTTATSSTTTTQPDFRCSPPFTACGSCGCGVCFVPLGSALTTGACVVPFADGGPCSIDPPTACPAGQTCMVTSFAPPMANCGVLCP